MTTATSEPTRTEQFWKEKQEQSAQAAAALEAHLQTRPKMEAAFAKADARCVELARELMPLRAAGSRSAERTTLEADLRVARGQRDVIRAEWGREHDRLRAVVRAFTDPELAVFCGATRQRCERLWERREFETIGAEPTRFAEDGRAIRTFDLSSSRPRCRHNFRASAEARQRQMQFLRQAQRLRERPLAELHALIREAEAEFRRAMDWDMDRLEVVTCSAAEASRLQESAEDSRPMTPMSGNVERGAVKFIY